MNVLLGTLRVAFLVQVIFVASTCRGEVLLTDPSALPALTKMLDGDPRQATRAAWAFEVLGSKAVSAVPALINKAISQEPNIAFHRSKALLALRAIVGPETPEVVPEFARALPRAKSQQEELVRILSQVGPPSKAVLTQFITEHAADARLDALITAVGIVHEFGDEGPSLIDSLATIQLRNADNDAIVAHAADTNDLIGGFVRSDLDDLIDKQQQLTAAWERIGRAAVPRLTAALSDPSYFVREAAINALGHIGHASQAIPALVTAAHDPRLLGAAEAALTEIVVHSDTDTLTQLVGLLRREPNPNVKIAVIHAITRLGQSIVPVLVELLYSPERQVGVAAAAALGKVGSVPPELTTTLRKRVQ